MNQIKSVTINDLVENFSSLYESDLPQLDAQLLLAHVFDKPRTWIAAHGDTHLTDPQIDSAQKDFARLKAGEPLPYILGHWEFFGLDFDITEDVLIPRPETETLVEKAIIWLQNSPARRNIADIGTGCGVIAVSLATHIPNSNILATDISSKALQIAEQNAKKHTVNERIKFIECDLFPAPAQERSIDLLCANLPYIPTSKLEHLPIFGREPTLALDGGADGLDVYRRLLKMAPNWLSPNGIMLLEIEASQGTQALSLAYDSFDNATIQLHQDLTGRDRLLEIILP